MRCACIDIGSNTTRLLVADVTGDALAVVREAKAFTRLGRACGANGPIPADAVAMLSAVVREQVELARGLGVAPVALRAVATAAARRAANAAQVCAALRASAGVAVDLLGPEEEARLAFAGATRPIGEAAGSGSGAAGARRIGEAAGSGSGAVGAGRDDPIAVVDVGGGSTELIVGTRSAGVTWSASLPLGSGDLADACLHGDPPTAAELGEVHARVESALAGVEGEVAAAIAALHAAVGAPGAAAGGAVLSGDRPARGTGDRPVLALAVGGSATSLNRVMGPRFDADRLDMVLSELSGASAAVVAVRRGLDPARVRLLPTAIVILAAAARRLGPLAAGAGGLREGVVLELARRG